MTRIGHRDRNSNPEWSKFRFFSDEPFGKRRAAMIFQDSNLHSDEPVSSVCVVVRYSVLQCVAVRCSVMIFQNTDLHSNDHFESRLFGNALYCVAACRSAMQYVPVCCRSISSLVFSGTDCIVHLYLNVLLPYSRNSCSHMFI